MSPQSSRQDGQRAPERIARVPLRLDPLQARALDLRLRRPGPLCMLAWSALLLALAGPSLRYGPTLHSLVAFVAHEVQVTLRFFERLSCGRLLVGQGVPGLLTVSRCSTTSSIPSKKSSG